MNTEEIVKFLDNKTSLKNSYVKIDFKKRDPIYGLFIKDRDFADLKSKNLWRIVTRPYFDEYKKSKNVNLAKIFSGTDSTRLTTLEENF